ncbi:hypothetical protein D3C80_968420 [compost metagenome]
MAADLRQQAGGQQTVRNRSPEVAQFGIGRIEVNRIVVARQVRELLDVFRGEDPGHHEPVSDLKTFDRALSEAFHAVSHMLFCYPSCSREGVSETVLRPGEGTGFHLSREVACGAGKG